ncbi:hypothetical protein KGQ90_04925 [Modicisalibacter tunisiensis]|uniref:hypothetical protein n=1 Tax=Modicisalibacter TaxID=574347 RepID=UPI0013CF5BF4|nr:MULTISPECIES: hypothetical protein [Modicisalibacter]MBZ9538289.1 hypothetical protein [Modicisalibacter tunisiensis]
MAFGNWFKRRHKSEQTVWVVKQVDDHLLHLCGRGRIEPAGADDATDDATLESGRFQGAVTLPETGQPLNARQFAALIPESRLTLVDDHTARWRERLWHVAWTPQRCWLHDGALTVERNPLAGQAPWVSTEDVSAIRAKAGRPRQATAFYGLEALSSPPDAADPDHRGTHAPRSPTASSTPSSPSRRDD